jgi:CheY-like chemotaxis protein
MLKISLSTVPNLEIVDAVSDGMSAIDGASRLYPDVILMDIELGGDPNGIDAGRTIKLDHPDMGIVILSSHRERQYLSRIAAEESSGWSYLLKQSVSEGPPRPTPGPRRPQPSCGLDLPELRRGEAAPPRVPQLRPLPRPRSRGRRRDGLTVFRLSPPRLHRTPSGRIWRLEGR